MVFKSKVDGWLIGVTRVSLGIGFFAVLIAFLNARRASEFLALLIPLAILAVVAAGIEWTFRRTNYRLEGRNLVIRAGIFRWVIPVSDIESLSPSRNPLSSPALSLDRIEIRHQGGSILVSPQDRQGFVSALKEVNPRIDLRDFG